MRLFGRYRLTTFQIIAFGFIALILTGTLLLSLPFADRRAGSAEFLDWSRTRRSGTQGTALT